MILILRDILTVFNYERHGSNFGVYVGRVYV